VAGAGAPLKQTILALRGGEQLADHDTPGVATVQVVQGRVRLVADGDQWELARATTSRSRPPSAHRPIFP
jgi:quercetin dioxygenase-like cupin family protein